MLSINKIQSNIKFGSGTLYPSNNNTQSHGFDKLDNYRKMNKSVYSDYVGGDISLIDLLSDKFEDLWNVLTKKNPNLEIKAKMIEKDLLNEAHKLSYFGMVA